MDERTWYSYENGATIGKTGLVGGRIEADVEWGDADDAEDADARLTLEALPDGFALTANLYGGWLQETARFESLADVQAAFDAAQSDLPRLAGLIPDEDDSDVDVAVETLNREVAAFATRFGGAPTV